MFLCISILCIYLAYIKICRMNGRLICIFLYGLNVAFWLFLSLLICPQWALFSQDSLHTEVLMEGKYLESRLGEDSALNFTEPTWEKPSGDKVSPVGHMEWDCPSSRPEALPPTRGLLYLQAWALAKRQGRWDFCSCLLHAQGAFEKQIFLQDFFHRSLRM